MTERQKKLLAIIIDEFIDSAEAVGSMTITNKYRLGISSATIRNEMADLVDQGYLEKPHSSSGRIPTNMGFKLFLNDLLSDLEELETQTSTNIYEDLFQTRFDNDELIYRAVRTLADRTHNLALVVLGKRVYYAGIHNLILQPEFEDRKILEKIMTTIEDSENLIKMFANYQGASDIKVIFGEDSGLNFMKKTVVIFSDIKLYGEKQGYVAMIGPNRMDYHAVLPLFDFIVKSLSKVVRGWQ